MEAGVLLNVQLDLLRTTNQECVMFAKVIIAPHARRPL